MKSTFKVKQNCLNIESGIKKNVGFKEDITEVKAIPYFKFPFKSNTIKTIINLKRTIDDLMIVFSNSGQSGTLEQWMTKGLNGFQREERIELDQVGGRVAHRLIHCLQPPQQLPEEGPVPHIA